MPQMLLPDAKFRSPTALPGNADVRDENVYSSIVVQHGGAGQQKVFTVPSGQAIPALRGGAIAASANAHQQNYTELTTNLAKAGELGSSLGDAAIRSVGLTVEAGGYSAAGALRAFGAGPMELSDILSKTFFQLKIAGKLQISGATHMFPSGGGMYGSVSTTGTTTTVGIAQNGVPGTQRRLKLPIMVARTDTIEGVFGVAGGASLAFSVTTADGQPTLIWFNLQSTIKGDVR